MADSIISHISEQKNAVPQWYVVLEGDNIIGGCGVIENDFHNRKDLTPNVCAVYIKIGDSSVVKEMMEQVHSQTAAINGMRSSSQDLGESILKIEQAAVNTRSIDSIKSFISISYIFSFFL